MKKKWKKLIGIMLGLVMVIGMTSTAFATSTTTDFSITVNNTPSTTNVSIVGKTFSAYKIFDVTYADTDNTTGGKDAYSYTISSKNGEQNNPWFQAVLSYMGSNDSAATADANGVYTGNGLTLTPAPGTATTYVVTTTATTTEGTTTSDFTDETARALADYLTAWLNSQTTSKPTADGTGTGAAVTPATDPATEQAVISNLSSAGYYLVTGGGSTTESDEGKQQNVVAAAALATTEPTVEIDIKAGAPTLDKEITKITKTTLDSNTTGEVEPNNEKGASADVGDTVSFKLTSNVPDTTGYDSYTFIVSDTLSNGLTLNNTGEGQTPFTVTIGEGGSASRVTLTKATVDDDGNVTWSADKDEYCIVEDTDGTTSFQISLQMLDENGNAKYNDNENKKITIEYSAILNDEALKTDVETNTATLEYSNDPGNTSSKALTPETEVYVYDFDIIVDKYTGDDSDTNNPATRLAGATFVLYKIEGETTVYYKFDDTTNDVSWTENKSDATPVTTDGKGAASFKGLEAGTYYLQETEAPEGYNLLTKDIKVEITVTYNDDGTIDTTSATSKDNGQYSITSKVENNTGSVLPSTGGIGTTIFYIVGIVIIIGACVLLITKRRVRK